MRCPSCHHENREEAKFCEACGSKLVLACSSCGNQVRSEAAFCDKCGVSLKTKAKGNEEIVSSQWSVPSPQPLTSSTQHPDARRRTLDPRPSAGERRQLTVMFCDLVGSTALSARMDPEEWRGVVQDYQRACAEVIRRFDGYVAQYLGDGLLVYFGYPAAHEDDAQRAVRAGLEIVATLQKQIPSSLVGEGQGEGSVGAHGRAPLQVRIGIHTGLVVISEIGDGIKRELLALGETPNLAARLQSVAEPDVVVVSAATYRLIEGFFDYQALGLLDLKGIAAPTQAYRITGEGEQRSRLEVAALRGLTPLVGREEESALLFRRWEQAKTGEGQAVLLNGEAGIGKSRLTQVLRDHIAQEPHARAEWRCSPYHQNSALYPVIEQLQRLLQFGRDDSPEEKFQKLAVGAHGHAPLQGETIPLLASLLSLPVPDHYPPLALTPQRQKQKTLEALLAWLLQEARQQPVLVVVEDLHWVDPSTLELLSLLIDQVPSARVLVVLTFRPDFSSPWAMAAHLTHVSLSRFARRQVEAMVEKVAGGKTLPSEIIQQIVEKTDGVPLFVEELTKTVIESVGATGRSPLQTIPATLHDSLMARLDRLNTAKEIAQLGATLGREFSYELIHAVSPMPEQGLQSALAKLVDAELLYQRGQPPTAHYTFKHALVQDAAYQSLLKSTRQRYHQQIAQVLEERFPETRETQSEALGHHYTEAGLVEQAIPYWQRAGQRAIQRSAHAEAVAHLTRGLEALKILPETPEHVQQDLRLLIALGPALMATKGMAAQEVEPIYTRARELCQKGGGTPQHFPALVGLWWFYEARSELLVARELAEQLFRLAHKEQDAALLSEAHCALGVTLLWLGEVTAAREHTEQGIAFHDPEQHHSLALLYGNDPGTLCRSYASFALWVLGYPDQALKRVLDAVTLAQKLSHPHSLVWAQSTAAVIHQMRREEQATQKWTEAQVVLATEQGFPLWVALGTVYQGWALAERGQREKGIWQIRQGLDAFRAIGTESSRTLMLTLLAEVYGEGGQVEEGLNVLAEALDVVDKTNERFYEAELYRLKGELTLQQWKVESQKSKVPNTQHLAPSTQAEAEAEACFLKAIEVSRRQQAKSLELRAVMSLVRLRQQQALEHGAGSMEQRAGNREQEARAKLDAARDMLSEIYNWFTEGFDTKDLQEAKALLEELNH